MEDSEQKGNSFHFLIEVVTQPRQSVTCLGRSGNGFVLSKVHTQILDYFARSTAACYNPRPLAM